MFTKANLLKRLRYKFESEPLARKLKEVFGTRTPTLGSDTLRTLLLLVMRNATTDSPWPLSNNPYAKYNDPPAPDDNLKFPLWQLVRASTAAPTYFPPEVIVLPNPDATKEKEFVFVDGGVTMYNNPAFQMFLMATLDRYWARKPEARWRTGADKMLIVSVGTGTSPAVRAGLRAERHEPAVQRDDDPVGADVRRAQRAGLAVPRVRRLPCRRPDRPRDRRSDRQRRAPRRAEQKLFTYVRYNAELTREGLDALGCTRHRAGSGAEARFGRRHPRPAQSWTAGGGAEGRCGAFRRAFQRPDCRSDSHACPLHAPSSSCRSARRRGRMGSRSTAMRSTRTCWRLRSAPPASRRTGPMPTAAAARSTSTCFRTCSWPSSWSPT